MRLYYQALGALVSKQAPSSPQNSLCAPSPHLPRPLLLVPTNQQDNQLLGNLTALTALASTTLLCFSSCTFTHLEAARQKTYSWLSALWAPAPWDISPLGKQKGHPTPQHTGLRPPSLQGNQAHTGHHLGDNTPQRLACSKAHACGHRSPMLLTCSHSYPSAYSHHCTDSARYELVCCLVAAVPWVCISTHNQQASTPAVG